MNDMKRYYNETTEEWYTEGQSMTRKIDNGVFSGIPTAEQLTEWGFTEYIEPTPTPAQQLAKAKEDKIQEIEDYNVSDAVNEFTLSGNPMWLTVEERQQIATQISANEAISRSEMTRWYNGIPFTFALTLWKQMLVALEVYVGDALNVTEAHKAAVMALDNVEDIRAYDYTAGYPEKLSF